MSYRLKGESSSPAGRLARLWHRVPVIVRAVAMGLLVTAAGHQPCGLLVLANLKLSPAIPWSVPLVTSYLWLYWRYLNGWGWPRSTSEARRRNLRARPLSPGMWRWSLLAGGLAMTAFVSIELFAQRFIPSDPPKVLDLSQLSAWTILFTYLTISAMAGVIEEAAFRGYMQSPIERRHGPFAAITIVALLFTFAHWPIYPAMSLAQFAGLLAISYGYGILARLTGSILPGLVIHATGNAVAFLFCWGYLRWTGSLRVPLLRESGPDSWFWLNAVAAAAFSAAAVWAYPRFAAVALRDRLAAPRRIRGT